MHSGFDQERNSRGDAAQECRAASDWLADQAERAEPLQLTQLFHTAVPVLKYLDWRVQETKRGYAKTILPINVPSSNQHITHQAALILIAADYTGGIALGTLLHGVPLVGIHPQKTDYGAYMWGAKADIRWIRPSTDDIQVVARIPEERHQKIVRRFFQGRRVLETVHIEMSNSDGPVAEATLTYWVQDTYALRRDAHDEKRVHPLFDHRRKTSAKLIAGLRAREQQKPEGERLFVDEAATVVAGNHGYILAERFCLVAPQLHPMVAMRTRHGDDLARKFAADGPFQLVNVGVGLDTRHARLVLPAGTKVFNLDIPTMLRRRVRELGSYADNRGTIEIGIDLIDQSLAEKLLASGFNPARRSLFFWEGGAMYFERSAAQRILSDIAKLMCNPNSRLWMDYVRPEVINNSTKSREVGAFINAIRALGEPFVNGYADVTSALAETGLRVEQDDASGGDSGQDDPIFQFYRFSISSRGP